MRRVALVVMAVACVACGSRKRLARERMEWMECRRLAEEWMAVVNRVWEDCLTIRVTGVRRDTAGRTTEVWQADVRQESRERTRDTVVRHAREEGVKEVSREVVTEERRRPAVRGWIFIGGIVFLYIFTRIFAFVKKW